MAKAQVRERGRADRPIGADGRTYHLGIKEGDLAPHCLLVGDPDRAERIAKKHFKSTHLVGDHRGLRSYTGIARDKVPMSVVTHGMGAPSMGMVLPEAVFAGARVFIRVGSCSTIQRFPRIGDVAILTGAVRLDGASNNWAPEGYPAVADYKVVSALEVAAKALKIRKHIGIGASTDCFVEGQGRPDLKGYLPKRQSQIYRELIARRVLIFEMENSALFIWCSTHGAYLAGSVCAIFGHRPNNMLEAGAGEDEAIKVAVVALALLATSST